MDAVGKLWDDEHIGQWHPKEALFDILPEFSELSIRALHFCLKYEQFTLESRHALIHSLAEEGFCLQEKLNNWLAEAKRWEITTHIDTDLLIGYAYYHSIRIYLSGTYDYHKHWSRPGAPSAPILNSAEVDWHVSMILSLGRKILDDGISGIFLLFPLRVAGARAIEMGLRRNIVELLQTTSKRGFTVANAIENDLVQLWASKDA